MAGMTPEKYQEYLMSEHWQEIRKQQLEMDGYCCARCGSKDFLEVHHINYNHLYEEQLGRDIITLCEECHGYFHEIKNRYLDQSRKIKEKYINSVKEMMKPIAERYYDEASELVARAAFDFIKKEKQKNYSHLLKATCELLELENATQYAIKCPQIPRNEILKGCHGVYNDACNKLSDMRKQGRRK